MDSMELVMKDNIISGLRKTGIFPTERQIVLCRLPQIVKSAESNLNDVSEAFIDRLETLRFDHQGEPKVRRKRVAVDPGKSISLEDLESPPAKRHNTQSSVAVDMEPIPSTSSSCTPDRDDHDVEQSDSSTDQSDTEHTDEEHDSEQSEDESLVGQSDTEVPNKSSLETGKWVIVQYKVRSRFLHYVGEVLGACDQRSDQNLSSAPDLWEVRFLRKSKKTDAFIAPNVPDIAVVETDEVIRVLPLPDVRRQLHRFSVKFDGLNMQ